MTQEEYLTTKFVAATMQNAQLYAPQPRSTIEDIVDNPREQGQQQQMIERMQQNDAENDVEEGNGDEVPANVSIYGIRWCFETN